MINCQRVFSEIDIGTLLTWFDDNQEFAFVDVREAGEFGVGHPLHAINVPYSVLERDILALVPRLGARIMLIDDGAGDIATSAARRLVTLGYNNVFVVDGGIAAWRAAEQSLFHGIHVPSKAFAEFVERAYRTPQIDPEELQTWREAGRPVVVLDCRPSEEFERFHVPGAINAPGAELLHLVESYSSDPECPIVVTCAGRTRGIIGAQALINSGVKNPVFGLRGGTHTWQRSGFSFESGARPAALSGTTPSEAAQFRAAFLAKRFDVRWVDLPGLRELEADVSRTTYLFDVRTEFEFRRGHLPNSIHAPGGQLVQTTDRWIGTRHARVVLFDEHKTRAIVTAHWLAQLGVEVYVLHSPLDGIPLIEGGMEVGTSPLEGIKGKENWVEPADAYRAMQSGEIGLVVGSSAEFRKSHPAATQWVNRARLTNAVDKLREHGAAVLFSDDDTLAHLIAIDLREQLPDARIAIVRGGVSAWSKAGLPTELSPGIPSDEERVDFLFWAHERHAGNITAISQYLEWEEQLPSQVGDPWRAGYRFQTEGELS